MRESKRKQICMECDLCEEKGGERGGGQTGEYNALMR